MKKGSKSFKAFLLMTAIISVFQIVSCKKSSTSSSPEPAPVTISTCSDGIKNQDEVEIDCGGSSCQPCGIKYPDPGTYGANILHGTQDTFFIPGTGDFFSLKAIVPVGSSLKIEIHRISGPNWGQLMGANNGWATAGIDANGVQTFDVLNPGTVDYGIAIKFVPMNPTNSAYYLVKYFENSTVETRRKIISWNN